MRWHTERVKPYNGDDPKLRHLADASQWRALNAEFEFFANDPRNIMLGASWQLEHQSEHMAHVCMDVQPPP